MSVDDIVDDLNTRITHISKGEMRIRCQEYMKLIYPLYVIANNREFEDFSYGTEIFSISAERENNIVTKITVCPTTSWDSSNLVKIDGVNIEETIRWCLSEFSTCINMAALWDTKK